MKVFARHSHKEGSALQKQHSNVAYAAAEVESHALPRAQPGAPQEVTDSHTHLCQPHHFSRAVIAWKHTSCKVRCGAPAEPVPRGPGQIATKAKGGIFRED